MPLPLRRRDRPFVRTVLHIVGAVSFFAGIWQVTEAVHFVRRAVRTTGHVVAREGDPTATDSGAHPDVVFADRDGRAVRYNQNGMGSRRVGTPLPVLYDPAAPADTAVVDPASHIWGTSLFFLFIGVGFTIGALWGEVYTNWDQYLAKPRS